MAGALIHVDLCLASANIVLHNVRTLFERQYLMSCNRIVQWFVATGIQLASGFYLLTMLLHVLVFSVYGFLSEKNEDVYMYVCITRWPSRISIVLSFLLLLLCLRN